jgi:hypothetical protein
MFIVVNRCERGIIHAKYPCKPIPLVYLHIRGVQCLVELRRRDVKLVGIDLDNRSIFLVKVANVEDILTVQWIYIVVELIPGVLSASLQPTVRVQWDLTRKSM